MNLLNKCGGPQAVKQWETIMTCTYIKTISCLQTSSAVLMTKDNLHQISFVLNVKPLTYEIYKTLQKR